MGEEVINRKGILSFEIAGTIYGIELDAIEEILQNPKISPMPWLSACFTGVCGWKGNILAVASLERLTTGKEAETKDGEEKYAVIVVKSKDYECGFQTAQNPYLLYVTEDDRLECEAEEEETGCRYTARYRVDETTVTLIDVEETLKRIVVCA